MPSLIYDPTIVKDPKRTPTTVSPSDLHKLHKTSSQIIYIDDIAACINCVQSFDLLQEDITIIRSRLFGKQNILPVR
jgi:hypothetical protein